MRCNQPSLVVINTHPYRLLPVESSVEWAHVLPEMMTVSSSSESDYGSDFPLEEENVLSQAMPVASGPESDYGSDFSLEEESSHSEMTHLISAPESDYGSDFSAGEENLLLELLENATDGRHREADVDVRMQDALLQAHSETPVAHGKAVATAPAHNGHEAQTRSLQPRADWASVGHARAPAPLRNNQSKGIMEKNLQASSMSLDVIDYPDLSRALSDLETAVSPRTHPKDKSVSGAPEDTRSPLERFRSFPKKPLTVTDLSSGAWCELQYWYTLTMSPGGRKTRTAAMRGGTKVHQDLEDQVHTTVRVNIASREEAFALRLWNLIQGLRTLRDTGFTRELEVWGVIQGQVINGVIDEASYTSLWSGFGEESGQNASNKGASKNRPKQSSLKAYFDPHCRRVYLTDIKTRGAKSLPTGAATRPAKMQLFLYHRLLSEMASQKVDFSAIIARYGLNAKAHFSDAFMAQMGTLYEEIFGDVDSDRHSTASDSDSSRASSPESSLPDLVCYRSIEQVVPLLESELRTTFPQGAKTLGDLVAIEYRHRSDGHILGTHVSSVDDEALGKYLDRNLAWWLGRKEPEGVTIEETYKCHICEFAEICQWRKDKESELLGKRARTQSAATARG